jgi:hypothetical protein
MEKIKSKYSLIASWNIYKAPAGWWRMKRTQNVLNDGKRESRLPEPITRTQQSREEEEPRVEQNTGRSLDVCLIGSQRLILHIPHGFSFEKKKKNKNT